jgi:hypothetical protein
MATKTARSQFAGFHESLERKQAELVEVLRKREYITIEMSADQMDEIQYASERDMAIQNVDRESTLLRDVRAALRRIQDGSFGTCIDLRIGDQSKAPGGRAVGSPLYPMPGGRRSGRAGENRSHQCCVTRGFTGSSITVR